MTEIHVVPRAAARLLNGHLWVYRSDVSEPSDLAQVPAGALVTVLGPGSKPLGSALYSSASQIALRLVRREAGLSRENFLELVRERVRDALQRRRTDAPLDSNPGQSTTAQRLLFSEADALPGIVADRYGELVVVQLLTQGTAQDDLRKALAEVLAAELASAQPSLTVWERPDPRIRELEELPPPPEMPLLHLGPGEPSTTAEFHLNGLAFGYDVLAGQKTGAFLDQRLNYQAAAETVRRSGRTAAALDVCTYQGGFALHLARVCGRVFGVDQSRAALQTAEANLRRNPSLDAKAVDWIQADAFALLRALDEARESAERPLGLPARFDAIVLDPPAFAKSRRALDGAVRGYKELNLRALRLLQPGGTLVTCSCSHHVSLEVFTGVLREAAADAGRRVQLLETRAAAPDHPEVLTLPETQYLKCLICRVD